MVKTVRERIFPALGPAAVGALFALGLILPTLHALSMDAAGAAVLACALSATLCAVAGLGGKLKWAALGLAALLFAVAAMGGGLARFAGMFGAAAQLAKGDMDSLRAYAGEVALLMAALLTLAGWSIARQSSGFYPALSLTMVAVLIIWFSGVRDGLWLFTPALAALIALFARSASERASYPRTLVLAALIVALALCATSLLPIRSQLMENLADRLRTYITDTLFFTEPRKVYSLSVDGYKPLEMRLGGPANIQERPVMTVQTQRSLLLRGTIYNEYNGLAWNETLANRRYLYTDPRYRNVRADIMDEKRPPDSLRESGLFETIDASITMQSDSASTVFLPLRTERLATPMDLVPYFNASSEIFITRDLKAGDTYTLSAPLISPTDPRLPSLLSQAEALDDPRDMSAYLGVPDAVAADVRTLTESLTSGAATPLEKALTIRDYLRSAFRYTLTPETPPANQDFVSYFLLRGKEGYCTYFASAMAVMGRIAGLPTRYVEGYLAEPVEGVALVTSKKAHAWAEVYFAGFGWIAFDATPPEGRGALRAGDEPDASGGGQGGQDGQDAPQDPGDGQDTQTPESEPSPPPENPPEGAGDGPNDTPDNPGGTEPTPSPAPEPTPDPSGGGQDKRGGFPWGWLLLLLVAAFAARALWTRPKAIIARRCKAEDERLLGWYQSILGLLRAADMGAMPCESPAAHALRLGGKATECGLLAVADAVTQLGYGRYGVSPAQAEEAEACYRALNRSLPLKARCHWLLARMLRGIGSIKQVP